MFRIDPATDQDLGLILSFIKELAAYERLDGEVKATVDDLRETLFGARRVAHSLIARVGSEPAGFALYFFNVSTFVGRRGLYLEDLYVRPQFRHQGLGRQLLARLARIAVDERCGRMEWAVLDWNEPALRAYRAIGAQPMSEWTIQRLSGAALDALAASA
ncbi:MAG TPA: GNAT family N-acetyltransferase [Vicinamibacterales bacterium]